VETETFTELIRILIINNLLLSAAPDPHGAVGASGPIRMLDIGYSILDARCSMLDGMCIRS
jgi:hypothetical protein